MLTAKDVSYWYDSEENTLYKDVNLNFEAGQLYGIIGSSGAGKTTLNNACWSRQTTQG